MGIVFDRERRWKINQAKRFVKAVARSNLDVESRAEARAKETSQQLRRRAAWIGKEVFSEAPALLLVMTTVLALQVTAKHFGCASMTVILSNAHGL